MKVVISYPPLSTDAGVPLLSQNRQFQYFREPTFIYPVVPAYAATLLKKDGHEVIWNDCIAQGWGLAQFLEFVRKEHPDVVALESKTPVIKQHWEIINTLKEACPDTQTVLMGDHVTALPEESFAHSRVDFVLTGGDYDFLLRNLCGVLRRKKPQATGHRSQAAGNRQQATGSEWATELEPGIWYRDNGGVSNTGRFTLDHDLNSLPFIDRELTHWELYAYQNGNFKRTPGSYLMAGRDCWYHGCTFCSWTTLYPHFRKRAVRSVVDEIGHLIGHYNIREIMDDTGTFPVGDWLREFCASMVESGYQRKVYLDCNMRFGALSKDDYVRMKEAGFRLLLFGLESGNQGTLDRINKRLTTEEIIASCKMAREAGLFPHITIMFGYPWEDYEDAKRTWELGKWLLKKDYAYTMQATIVIPYPGTPLFAECREKDWLISNDWSYYDMKNPVMKIPFSPEALLGIVQSMYSIGFHPQFIMRKLLNVRDTDDVRYFWRAFLKVTGHVLDYRN